MRTLVSPLPRVALLAVAIAALQTPGIAQEAVRDSSAHIRFGGDVTVPAGAREGAVIVVRGDATIAGEVRGVVVLEGDALIAGGRVGELTVVRGRAVLTDSARVDGDVHLLDGEISVEPGSSVAGRVERGVGRRVARHLVGAAALIGLGFLIALVLGGVLATAVFADSVRATGALIRSETGTVLLATGVLWIALPIAAGLLIPTLIGLPMGLGYFLFVLPLLGFLGLIVAGTWLGDLLLRRMTTGGAPPRPTLAAALGITLLLLVGRIPLVGIIATALVLLGTGAIALRTLRAMRAPAAGLPPTAGASL